MNSENLKKLTQTLNKADDDINFIEYNYDNNTVYLTEEGDTKNIGKIIFEEGEYVYYKQEDELEIHRKTNSWSVAKPVLEEVDKLVYSTSKADYILHKEMFWFHGQEDFKWNKKGILRKVYFPLDYWNIHWKNPRLHKITSLMGNEWGHKMYEEFNKEYLRTLQAKISQRRQETKVYPKSSDVFNAFKSTPFSKVKVVILGQDPYHNGVAHGFAFSSKDPDFFPASIQNIYKEIERDIYDGFMLDKNVNLEYWTTQGVLLLNTALTVEAGKPASHQNIGWETFTTKALEYLVNYREGIIFIGWGNNAKEVLRSLPNRINKKHLILTSTHPSPFSAHKGFLGCGHFSKCNKYLKEKNLTEIDW